MPFLFHNVIPYLDALLFHNVIPNVLISFQVRAVVDQLMLTEGQVRKVMSTLEAEMWDGLSQDQGRRKKTSLQMENTYVRSLLNGKGKY